jgi:hypothetical protein
MSPLPFLWIRRHPNVRSGTRLNISSIRYIYKARYVTSFKRVLLDPTRVGHGAEKGIFLAPVIQMLVNKTGFRGKKDDSVMKGMGEHHPL